LAEARLTLPELQGESSKQSRSAKRVGSNTHDGNPHSLIGEHIDYALFGVFPAAIERDILIALGPRPLGDEPGVVVANAEAKYTEQTFTPSRITKAGTRDRDAWVIDINAKELRWDSYVKAGYYVRSRHHSSSSVVCLL